MNPETPLIDVDVMRAAATKATAVLGVLANQNRLLLLCQLSQGEKCVKELEDALDLHQPSLSQQLGVLRSLGVVQTRRDGKQIYYSIADKKVLALLQTLYDLYCPNSAGGRK